MTIKRREFIKYTGLGMLSVYFTELRAEVGTDNKDVLFFQKNEQPYSVYRALFNKRLVFFPRIIAVCKTEIGVQKAIQYANQLELTISIKSGGHSFEGFCLNNNGLVVDVSNMNKIDLNVNNQLIAEPAVRLEQLYRYCLPKGRLLPAGSCGSVGLSGLTLGGGYGFFSREFGLTCDYLIGLRMVTAEGKVIDSEDFPELLWACRGGGNGNFGVVTQLRYETVVAPTTLYQHRFQSFKLDQNKAIDLARFWFDQCNDLPNHAFSAFVLNGRTLTVMFTSTQNDDSILKILHEFDKKMDKNAGLKPDPVELGVTYYYGRKKPLNFKNISAGYYNGFSDLEGSIKQIVSNVMTVPGVIFQINTLGGEINNPSRFKEGAYPHRNVRYLGEAQCYWKEDKHLDRSMAVMKEIQETLHENKISQHYVNYPDLNLKDHSAAYYGEGYERLQRVKSILDPKKRFYYKQSVEPSSIKS